MRLGLGMDILHKREAMANLGKKGRGGLDLDVQGDVAKIFGVAVDL